MTKKDYIIIGNAVKKTEIDLMKAYSNDKVHQEILIEVIDELVENFQFSFFKDNNRFNPEKFYEFINN